MSFLSRQNMGTGSSETESPQLLLCLMEATYDKKLCLIEKQEHSDEECDLQEVNSPSAAFLHVQGDIHQL